MKKFFVPALAVVVAAGFASMAFAQTRAPAPSASPPQPGTVTPAPASPLDGLWRGTSDGGSCNAPLDYQLTIESGIVDGSAYDTTAQGPVPNTKKSAPPPPGPGLWQVHGLARATGPFKLISVASVKGTDQRRAQLSARSEGDALIVSETSGCRRTARLVRG
ncbi:hypothetical protein [Reyranella sp.]|uniref:hypothetical protein n=1 Tax=Reyranella sp. TaxID=1929291 RepID=UPI00121A0521|nr:hypothetical protein [Reyranella sp.]TAJ86558.1 MAG: hypothetical protein EPO50_13310 [Reyranella sp.]